MSPNDAESKSDRFKRLAEPRVDSTIKKIKIIGNLAASSYEYNAEQVEKILTTLKSAVEIR